MAAEYELTLNDYLQILRRRALHLVVTFVALLGIALGVAVAIPPIYQSTGTILIESQQIPTDLVKATVTSFAGERIEIIRQRVMTRENLMRIIEKYKLFSDKRRALAGSELVDEMRQSILIELVGADHGRQKGEATIAFKISFEYHQADIANKVANELVTLFLDENVKSRTERATETTVFLAQEADRLKAELEKIENQVAVYKQEHANALPEHLAMRMSMMQSTETELGGLERDYKDIQERLRYLDIELESAKSGFGSRQGTDMAAPTPASELERLNAEYARLSATYKETHPDVKALKRKIEALEKAQPVSPPVVDAEKKAPAAKTGTDLMVAKVQAQINAGNERLASIDQQRKVLRSRLAQIQGEITRSPQVAHGLTALLRDYETAKAKYEEVSSKRGSARIAENLEQENKAERFSLLEAPQMPDKPIKPDRKKIIAMGFFLAIAGAGGLVMALETANQRVRGVEALIAIAGQRPLAVVPYITTQAELNRRKHLNKYIAAAILLLILICVAVVHFLWMPLDILTYKIMARFS